MRNKIFSKTENLVKEISINIYEHIYTSWGAKRGFEKPQKCRSGSSGAKFSGTTDRSAILLDIFHILKVECEAFEIIKKKKSFFTNTKINTNSYLIGYIGNEFQIKINKLESYISYFVPEHY